MEKEFLEEEIKYFEKVTKVIDEDLITLKNKRDNLKNNVKEERKTMWEDGKHGVGDFEDAVLLTQQNENVVYVEKLFYENEKEIEKLTKMRVCPYFGRFDYIDREFDDHNTIYLGMYGLKDSELVVDWRAPICSVFYEFDLGEGYYTVNSEKILIDITLKRQYRIENGQFKYMYDTDAIMHDSILGEVLSNMTNNKLKVIVSSIQKEQNKAIRCSSKKSVLIYGLAGSGKTSVGLHRLAYVLYNNRGKIASNDIVVLSNNSIFNSYISNILPELGENPAIYIVFSGVIKSHLPAEISAEDYYEQLKYVESNPNSARTKNIKLKYSYEFIEFFVNYFDNYVFDIPLVKYNDDVIISSEIVNSKIKNMYHTSFKARLNAICDLVKKTIDNYFLINKEKIYDDIMSKGGSANVKRDYRIMAQSYADRTINDILVENEITPMSQLLKVIKIYENKNKCSGMSITLEKSFEKGNLHYEDALLYVLVCILMGDTSLYDNVYQVLIDEVQDFSLLQLYIAKRLFPKCSFTLLGDIYQAINDVTTIRKYSDFKRIFGDDIEEIKLPNCYRSSSNINSLAFKILNKYDNTINDNYSYFSREYKEPEFIVSKDYISTVSELLKKVENYNLVGIVMPNLEAAIEFYSKLDNKDIQLVVNPSDEVSKKIVMLPLLLAKGLEFDAVVLIDAFKSNKDNPFIYQRMYLGFTRALHELYIVEDTEVEV